MFTIGQQVICINNTGVEDILRKDAKYVIQASTTMPCCGKSIVDVGINRLTSTIFCYGGCGKTIKIPDSVYWFYSQRFALIEEKFEKMSFTKIVEEVITCNN